MTELTKICLVLLSLNATGSPGFAQASLWPNVDQLRQASYGLPIDLYR